MTQAVVQVRNIVARSGFANPLTLEVLVTDEDYLKVYADTTLLDNGPDYTITGIGDPNGISIEIIGAEDVDEYVGVITFTALYDPPLDQQTDLSAGGVLGRGYESGLDQQNRRIQALGDRVDRALKVNVNIDGDIILDPVDGLVPMWDDATQQFLFVETPSSAAAEAAAAAAADSAAAAAIDAGEAAASAAAAAIAETAAELAETNAETAEVAAEAAQAAAEAAAAAAANKLPLAGGTMTGPIGFTHQASPANPAAGVLSVFAKSDEKVYTRTSAGVETEIGGAAADDSITNAKLANMATATIKGRETAGTGDPEDLTPAQARNVMDTAPYVADRTALAALDTTKDTVAWLKETGREGPFQWDSSNLSAFVTLDTLQGIYVPPASDTTGASGAWVRREFVEINVKWFGAKGDLSQDDQPAVQCAVNVAAGRQIVAPVGQYRMNTTVSYTGIINLRGDGNGAGPGPAAQSNSNVTQFLMYFSNNDLFSVTSNYPSVFRDFQINVTPASRPATSGAGIHISGPVGSTNANSKVLNVSFTNVYRGVQLTRPAMPTVRGCYFDSFIQFGVFGHTSAGIEGSLGNVDGNFFYGTSGSTTQTACISTWIGYGHIYGNLILGASIGVQIAANNYPVGAVRVFDNFIENQGTTGVAITTQDGSDISMVGVYRNEFSNVAYVTAFDSSIKISDYSSGTDYLDDVLIADNVHRHTLDTNARFIWIMSGRHVKVAREQFENLGTGSGTVGIDAVTFAGAALKKPFTIEDCTFLGTFATGRYKVGTQCQIVEAPQIVVAAAVVALTNNITTAQSIFAAANDALTVQPLTTYRFRAHLKFNTGATTHTTSFGFGGTATFTACDYTSIATSSAANTLATPQMRRVAAAAAAVLTATSTAVTTDIVLEGVIRINGGGTIIPQVTFSAGPTGTCETAIDSFFELEPIGSNTVAALGDWA